MRRIGLGVLALVAVAVGILFFGNQGEGGGPGPREGSRAGSALPGTAGEDRGPVPVAPSEGTGGERRTLAPGDRGPGEGGLLDFVILHEDETPVGDAAVLLFRGEEVLDHARTDRNGTAGFAALFAPAEVAGVLGHRLLFRNPVPPGPGEHTIRIPLGAVVAGRVLVNGAPPNELLELHLFQELPVPPEVRAPAFLEAALGVQGGFSDRRVGSTALDGGFRFADLPPDWSGRLFFPPGFTLEENGSGALVLAHPARDLLLPLVGTPAISGVVLDPRKGEPVAGARIDYNLVAGSQTKARVGFKADGKGRFRIPLDFGSLERASLDILAPGVGTLSLEIHDVDGERGRDLGDLVLHPVRTVAFQVRDEKGKPVAGALARLEGKGRPGEPTDAAGLGTLADAPLAPFTMTVDALGFRQAAVTVTAALDGPLPVTLERSGRLEILIQDPDGKPVRGLVLILTAPRELLEKESFQRLAPFPADSIQARLGASTAQDAEWFPNPDGSWKSLRFSFEPGEDGRVLLSGLRSGIPFDVDVREPMEGAQPLAARKGVILDRGEWRRLVLSVPGAPRLLTGRVVDGQGNPLRAWIQIRAKMKRNAGAWAGPASSNSGIPTDEQGRFRLEGIYADAVDLEGKCQGFLPKTVLGLPVPRDGKEIEIVLEKGPGRAVRLEIAGPGGQRIPAEGVGARRGPFHLAYGRREEDGRFLVEGLPSGRVELIATVGGREFSQLHDTAEPEATLQVPAFGSVRVRWSAPIPARTNSFLELVPEDSPGEKLEHQFLEKGEPPGFLLLPIVFPGRYRCRITLFSNDSGGDWVFPPEVWRASAPVTVRAGEEASVSLGPE